MEPKQKLYFRGPLLVFTDVKGCFYICKSSGPKSDRHLIFPENITLDRYTNSPFSTLGNVQKTFKSVCMLMLGLRGSRDFRGIQPLYSSRSHVSEICAIFLT